VSPVAERRRTALDADVLAAVYQHRIITAEQLTTLVHPQATRTDYVRRRLRALREDGLIAARAWGRGSSYQNLWYLTENGASQVEAAGELPVREWRLDPAAAGEYDPRHTLATVDVACTFVTWARRLRHECTPWDVVHEVAHRIGAGSAARAPGDHLIADALLHYVAVLPGEQRVAVRALVEVDRSTMSAARLAAKLAQYARYYDYSSTGGSLRDWQNRYPHFPAVLVVLTGASPAALERRAMDLRALALADRRVRRLAGVIDAGVTTAERLAALGPFGPAFLPLLGEQETTTDISFGRLRPPTQPGAEHDRGRP